MLHGAKGWVAHGCLEDDVGFVKFRSYISEIMIIKVGVTFIEMMFSVKNDHDSLHHHM